MRSTYDVHLCGQLMWPAYIVNLCGQYNFTLLHRCQLTIITQFTINNKYFLPSQNRYAHIYFSKPILKAQNKQYYASSF